MKKRLMRDKEAGIFSGLCQGLGERFELSPWIFRALFVIPALPFVLTWVSTVASIAVYIILSILIKDKHKITSHNVSVEYEIVEDKEGKEEDDADDCNQ